jgi:glycolate oxidase FAD binding subunit
MTDITIKVLPKPETEVSVLVRGLAAATAIEAMTAAIGSACDVSGAAHLPEHTAARIASVTGAGGAVTALRLEGFAPSVAHRRHSLETLLKPYGELATLDTDASSRLWQSIRDVAPFAAGSDPAPLWRISTAPSRGAKLADMIAATGDAQFLFDWAGGLVWVALGARDDAGAADVRRAVATTGGHATLVRASAAARAAVDVFEPQAAAVAALTKRVKASFDPKGVLNPGRMWAGV